MHRHVIPYVSAVEHEQSDLFDRFVKLAAFYDPNDRSAAKASSNPTKPFGSKSYVIENVIASNVEAATAEIAATQVRPRFLTDDADWSTQRRARHLSWYAEGLMKKLGAHEKGVRGFHAGALKGTGLVKVYVDRWSRIKLERTIVDDIVVDEQETRAGEPRQMHHRMLVDRDVLKAEHPDHEREIDQAQTGGGSDWRFWADYRPISGEQVVVIESWHLPLGVEGQDGYKPGRHTIVIDGADLVDEEWHKERFPFARFVWSERDTGWYGLGLAERIIGHQLAINKYNFTEDAQLDRLGRPITWVSQADAKIAVQSRGHLGTMAIYRGAIPQTVAPNPISDQALMLHQMRSEGAFNETGISRLAAQGRKPAGIESGVGLREYRDQTTQRFAHQEAGFERFMLDICWLIIDCAKDLGEDAPEVIRKSKFGRRRIRWDDVDMDEASVQLVASSTLPRTAAGRSQLFMEMAQGGIISKDASLRFLVQDSSLDINAELSLHTAALEDIERCIEEIEDGAILVPEPYQNLKLGVWRFQQALLKDQSDGAPEEILEGLRQWITQAAWVLSQAEAPPAMDAAQPMDAAAAAPPMDPLAAGAAAGLPGAPGDVLTGAGITPANLLQ